MTMLKKINWQKIFSQAGSSLIEILVATTVVALVLTSLSATLIFSLKSGAESKYQDYANYYAIEAAEFFQRERIKLGFSEFANTIGTFPQEICMLSVPTGLAAMADNGAGCDVGLSAVGNEFTRDISYVLSGSPTDTVELTIKVTWQDGANLREREVKKVFKAYVN